MKEIFSRVLIWQANVNNVVQGNPVSDFTLGQVLAIFLSECVILLGNHKVRK